MTVSVSSALLATANAAAAGAADGSKNAAFCGALSTGIGSGYKLVARRDGVIVLSMTMSGSLASSSYGLSIPDAYSTLTVLTAADIDTGSWTLRVEKASDAAVYLHGTLGTAGTDFTLSADLDPAVGIALYGLFLRSPSIDTTSSTVPVGVGGSWTLTFEDHFDGGSLDSSKWSVPIWYGDLAGGSAGPNVANADSTVNYDVNAGGNSCLRIWPALMGNGKFFNRTIHTDSMGGSTASGSKFRQKYGFFEMRAKLPRGRGCWPAFWLFGHYNVSGSSPVRPEIDILESYCGGYDYVNNAQPGWADSSLRPTTWAPTFHSDAGNESARTSSGPFMETPGDILSAAFHVYGLRWSAGGVMEWFYDGVSVGSTTYSPLDKLDTYPLAIYLDLWFGSASGYANTSETPTGTGNAFEVDYVRAWS